MKQRLSNISDARCSLLRMANQRVIIRASVKKAYGKASGSEYTTWRVLMIR